MSERVVYIIIPVEGPPMLSLGSVVESKHKVWIWDREYSISEPSDLYVDEDGRLHHAKVNLYLSALAENSGVTYYGPAQYIGTEKEYHRIFKHWQALAVVNHWYDCPRCGGFRPDNVHIGRTSGKLSRWDNTTMICNECGIEEKVAQQRGEDISPDGKRKWAKNPNT